MWLWGSSLSCGMFYNYQQQLGHCAGLVCLQDDAAARLAGLVTFDILELAMVDGTRAGERTRDRERKKIEPRYQMTPTHPACLPVLANERNGLKGLHAGLHQGNSHQNGRSVVESWVSE